MWKRAIIGCLGTLGWTLLAGCATSVPTAQPGGAALSPRAPLAGYGTTGGEAAMQQQIAPLAQDQQNCGGQQQSTNIPVDQAQTQPAAVDQAQTQPAAVDQGQTQPAAVDQGQTQPAAVDQGQTQPAAVDQGQTQPAAVSQNIPAAQTSGADQQGQQPLGDQSCPPGQGLSTGTQDQPAAMGVDQQQGQVGNLGTDQQQGQAGATATDQQPAATGTYN